MSIRLSENVAIKDYNSQHIDKIKNLSWEDDFVRGDVLDCLERWPECGVVIEEEGEVVAVAVFTGVSSCTSFTLYVEPLKRGKGFGRDILKALEGKMIQAGVVEVVCDFKMNKVISSFLAYNGYKGWFRSNFMVYEGQKLPVGDYEIMGYEDEYYESVQKVYSEAFHNMRLLVGIESSLSEASEEERKANEANKKNIFVLKSEEKILAVMTLNGNEIDAVAVEINEQGKGYGKAVVSYGVNKILDKGEESVTLWAVEGNPAKYLYEKLGFKVLRLHEFVKKNLCTNAE